MRCGCGALLVPDLHFCVACGARSVLAGRVPALAGAAGPVSGRPIVPPRPMAMPVQAPVPMPARPMAMPAPAPAVPGRSNAPWIVAAVAALVALLLVSLATLTHLRPTTTTVAVPTPVALPTVTVGVPVARDTAGTSEDGDTGTYSSSTTAAASLEGIVAADRPAVEGVVGTWVPQLSAKHEGTKADGITYDDASILSHYSSLAARYPSAALLFSGDWPVFNGSDYWVVIYPQSFTTAAAANAWCDAQGFAADDCLAKKLSHSGGPAGTTVPR